MPKHLHRTEGFASPSTAKIFLQDITRLIPMRLLEYLYDYFPSASLNSMRANRDITHRFAKDLLDHKSDSIARGKSSRDVMSILGMYWTVTFVHLSASYRSTYLLLPLPFIEFIMTSPLSLPSPVFSLIDFFVSLGSLFQSEQIHPRMRRRGWVILRWSPRWGMLSRLLLFQHWTLIISYFYLTLLFLDPRINSTCPELSIGVCSPRTLFSHRCNVEPHAPLRYFLCFHAFSIFFPSFPLSCLIFFPFLSLIPAFYSHNPGGYERDVPSSLGGFERDILSTLHRFPFNSVRKHSWWPNNNNNNNNNIYHHHHHHHCYVIVITINRTLLLAGHETTSNTLGWGFLELAKNPHIQTKLRQEIHAMEAHIRSRRPPSSSSSHSNSSSYHASSPQSEVSPSEFTVADLENMPYTQAVIKEILRFHPVVFHNHRQAGRDDVIPLAKPIKTKSGKVIGEIPIAKGTRVVLAIAAYNRWVGCWKVWGICNCGGADCVLCIVWDGLWFCRDPDVWGEDSHTFNPDRWLTPRSKRGASVGVYSNL